MGSPAPGGIREDARISEVPQASYPDGGYPQARGETGKEDFKVRHKLIWK